MENIVLSHKEERDRLLVEPYIPRESLSAVRLKLDNNLIKVIIGPRRAGKSVFAVQLLKNVDFAYLNFDDERLFGITDYDKLLKSLVEVYGETKYFFFDEIQNIENWELFLNRLQRKGFYIVITGSNSKLLSSELATHLTGRFLEFKILPFSFSEYLRAKDFNVNENIEIDEREGLLLKHLNEYLISGGYPEVIVKNIDGKSYISTLFESVIFKDIVKRYNIRFSRKLYDLSLYLISNHSNEFSYTRLKQVLDFRSVQTLENYVEYLKEAFLVFTLNRYSNKIQEQIKSPRKVYAIDPGAINAIKFKLTPDLGRLIENIVAIELLRKGDDFFCYKTQNSKEVDFAIKEGFKIGQLIQVCYDISNHLTKKREISALFKASNETECNNLIVLTWNYESKESYKDKEIIFLPIWKWLIKF